MIELGMKHLGLVVCAVAVGYIAVQHTRLLILMLIQNA